MRTMTIASVVGLAIVASGSSWAESPLKLVQTIPLESVEGRVDHMSYDPKLGRLYVAALGNNTVEMIDVAGAKQAARIGDVRKPQGVCVLPDSRLVVASGNDGKVRFFDSEQKLLATVPHLDDADNVRYDPAAQLLYVGYGDGALAVIDPTRQAKVGEIKLSGHPESFQLEAHGKLAFVNVPDAHVVAVVDRARRQVVSSWAMNSARANFPMALDEEGHRLFVGCRRPARLVVLDTASGREIQSADCCGDADDLFYDAAAKRLYVIGGEGCINVFAPSDGGRLSLISNTPTAPGARTGLYVPELGRLFVAVPHRGEQKAEIRAFEAVK